MAKLILIPRIYGDEVLQSVCKKLNMMYLKPASSIGDNATCPDVDSLKEYMAVENGYLQDIIKQLEDVDYSGGPTILTSICPFYVWGPLHYENMRPDIKNKVQVITDSFIKYDELVTRRFADTICFTSDRITERYSDLLVHEYIQYAHCLRTHTFRGGREDLVNLLAYLIRTALQRHWR